MWDIQKLGSELGGAFIDVVLCLKIFHLPIEESSANLQAWWMSEREPES